MLAGMIMNSGGITRRLFGFANSLVGHMNGGLAQVNVLASIIFAGMSGSATADSAGLGQVEIKAMVDEGFDKDFSAAVTAASATIGPIIPPSIGMVIYGSIAGVSIAALFIGGLIPGLLSGLALMIINNLVCKKRKYPRRDRREPIVEMLKSFWKAFPPLLTPIIILGGIVLGIFTPTEAAAVASLYAFILGYFVFKEITLRNTINILFEVGKISASIMLIVSTASVFGWVLAHQAIPQQIAKALISTFGNKYLILLVLNILLLILGCFMETVAITLITVPVLSPLLDGAGISKLHFGVVLVLNLTIGLITPPMGMSLYVVSAVAKTTFEMVLREIIPYLIVLIAVLFLITYIPALVTYLPNILLTK
jgi:tripartite ATP-independent transporter DctM subunit